MPHTQEVRVTVEAPLDLSTTELVRLLQSVFGRTLIEVAEERHIYGNAEDGDTPWRRDDVRATT